jgi:hypothetical protein
MRRTTIAESRTTASKPRFRISAACSLALLICAFAVSSTSAHVPPVYIGSTAAGSPSRVAEHPGRLVTSGDCEIHGIRWTHWAARTTTGSGTFLCGTGVSVAGARLVASRRIWCGGHEVYSRLAWTTPDDVTPSGKHFSTLVPFRKSWCEFTPEG